ncbi:MAG: hypothetical protein JSV04_07085 [Candidatus Heimdallarchaeota archaeon]|nr:MAG: hypothetical protein JSV04_07085 [Candidatus Heimdallarchaeota archaeon]
MNDWDLVLFETSKKKSIKNRFRITEKTMTAAGQHGKATVLEDEQGKEWLLKTFSNIIDFELKEVMDLEVDLKESPEDSRDRMHLWRTFNELTASRLGQRLHLNVPEAIIVCSQQIANHPLEQTTTLPLGDVIILDEDEEDGETTEEYYEYSERDPYTLETSSRFEQLLANKSGRGDPTVVLALLLEKIPNTINLDEFLDSKGDLDEAFKIVQQIDDGYVLLPFDVWLNDPDRNAGNYLVQSDEEGTVQKIWGIDYEMWSLGSDIWMEEDEITKGRSYLTAIIHPTSHIFDPRVNQTVYRIRSLGDEELTAMTRTPQIACKYFEYHITQKNLDPDERIKLKQAETNLEDFLVESRPRSDKLSDILIKQIGFPADFKK